MRSRDKIIQKIGFQEGRMALKMRSCVYCGKTLEKGEKCNCFRSIQAREAKNKAENTTKTDSSYYNFNNTYTTGYTKKEKKNRFEKIRRKWKELRYNKKSNGFRELITSFLKDPVNKIANPFSLSPLQLAFMVWIEGIILAGGGYFLSSLSGKAISVLPVIREYSIMSFLLTALFGGLALALAILMVFGVFWCIDRFILKRTTPFFEFAIRLCYAALPVAVLGIAGIIMGFFSIYTLLILYVAGIVMWIILTYESLKCEWSFISPSRVFYLVSAGLVFAIVIGFNILRF